MESDLEISSDELGLNIIITDMGGNERLRTPLSGVRAALKDGTSGSADLREFLEKELRRSQAVENPISEFDVLKFHVESSSKESDSGPESDSEIDSVLDNLDTIDVVHTDFSSDLHLKFLVIVLREMLPFGDSEDG